MSTDQETYQGALVGEVLVEQRTPHDRTVVQVATTTNGLVRLAVVAGEHESAMINLDDAEAGRLIELISAARVRAATSPG